MSYDDENHKIAAQIVGGGDYGLLHYKFSQELDELLNMNGQELSREMIVIFCWFWGKLNPNEKIYGE